MNELLAIQRQRLIDAGFIVFTDAPVAPVFNPTGPSPTSNDGESFLTSVETEALALANEAGTVISEAVDGVEKTVESLFDPTTPSPTAEDGLPLEPPGIGLQGDSVDMQVPAPTQGTAVPEDQPPSEVPGIEDAGAA
jgi:hypothetical protein